MKKPYSTLVAATAVFFTLFGQAPLALANPNVRDGIVNFTDWTVHSNYSVVASISLGACAQNGPMLGCTTTVTFTPAGTINFADGRNWAFSFELPPFSTSTFCFAAPFGDGYCGAQHGFLGEGVYPVGSSTEVSAWIGGIGFGDGTELGLQAGCIDKNAVLPCVLAAGQAYSLNITLLWADTAGQPPLVTDGEVMTMTIWDRGTPLPQPPAREPVVIVPGIMGSELKRASDGTEVWPNAAKMLFSPSDDYLNDLTLSPDGKGTTDIATGDIVRQEFFTPFYENLIQSLKDDGYEEGSTLFVAPYDWRFGVASSAAEIAPILARAASSSPSGKINVIAHSMGGLLMKEYLANATTSFINKLVLAGVPQLGAPKVFKLLDYGDDLGLNFFGIGMNQGKVREISANMPGVYDLLPSRRYVTVSGGYVKDFRNGAATVLSYDQTGALAPNASLAATADIFHQGLDGRQFNINASSVYNIIGCENNTLGEIDVYDGGKFGIAPVNGDGTVPLTSAFNLSSGYNTFFALKDDHVGLVQHGAPLGLIRNIVDGAEGEPASGISRSLSDCMPQSSSPETILVSSHGPTDLQVYDDEGHHTGPNDASGTIELGIPGSSYEVIGKDHFAILPTPAHGTYHVTSQAAASGTLDLTVEDLNTFVPKKKTTYLAVPLKKPKARATLDLGAASSSQALSVDTDNNGTPDVILPPSSVLVSSTSADIDPPMLTMPVFPPNILSGATTTLIFSATDTVSGVAFVKGTLNGIPVKSGDVATFNYLGTNVFRLEAEDNAGNPSVREVAFTVSAARSISFSPSADTYIREGKKNQNQGAERMLRIREAGANRALIRFDEGDIRRKLGTSTIVSATLQFPIAGSRNNWGKGREVDLLRMVRDWTERGATWNCANDIRPENSSPNCPNDSWNMLGGSLPFVSVPTASTTITNHATGTITFEVTADLKKILSGAAPNNGWIIKKKDEHMPGLIEFSSREASAHPTLVVQSAP
jgi:hypothetical protein